MKTLILVLMTAMVSGCAHQTIHDYCVGHADHYSSYDECYAERTQRQQQLAHAFDGMGQSRSISCTTIGTQTNCH